MHFMALPNYVKFQRGTEYAWSRLANKDQNTLYFIYDAEHEDRGQLWLGNRLIGSVGEGTGINTLAGLTDVLVSDAGAGSFLVLNSDRNWVSISAQELASILLEAGGNFVSIDEQEFQFNPVNGNLELKGFTSAAIGLVPVKSQSGLGWINLPPDLSSQVGNLQTELSSANTAIAALESGLQGVDGKINSAIANANHLKYEVINDLSLATATNVIYLYPNSNTATNNLYEEYLFSNGQLEKIGITDIDLSQYATTTALSTLDTRVGNLESSLNNINNSITSINSQLISVQSSLTAINSMIIDNYVLITTFNAVVGDLSSVNGVLNNLDSDDSITETLIDIYERLTWTEMN